MIKSIRHKGLKRFYDKGDPSRLQPNHVKKIRMILARLDGATELEAMNYAGSGLHPLKGELKGFWAVSVSGNYRIIFRFEDGDAFEVGYLDYH